MSWMSRANDERLIRAMEMRRDVLRGPLPRQGSADVDEALAGARIATHAFSISTMFLIIIVILLAAATAMFSMYSGALRWILYAVIVGVVGYVALRAVGGVVLDPARLAARPTAAGSIGGELSSLRTILYRATGGLAYSQLRFEERMREAFLEKVRVSRDLPEGALRAAMRDPAKLQAILGDKELTVFVLESARNSRMYPATTAALPKRADFSRYVAAVLDRMEAWR